MNPLSKPGLSTVTALSVAILIGLGTWQVHRLDWKTELIETVTQRTASAPQALSAVVDAEDPLPEYQPVTLSGFFLKDRVAKVSGTYDGVPGWYVFQPLQWLKNDETYGGIAMVNRGFVTKENFDAKLLGAAPEGQTTVTGLLRLPREIKGLSAWLAPAANLDRGEFYTRDMTEIGGFFFGETPDIDQILPLYVDEGLSDAGEGAVIRTGTTRLDFNNRHLGYAITWYGLAIVLLGVYAAMLRRP